MNSANERQEMVRNQLERRGITNARVLDAMRQVPRDHFLPPDMKEFAYEDCALPLMHGQTISQPYIVALMAEALDPQPADRILEIGAGSGYGAAVLSRLVSRVVTVERDEELVAHARRCLADLGYDNVEVIHADGSHGWEAEAPYDSVAVAAGGADIPAALKEQLRIGGTLVIPIGKPGQNQKLLRLLRIGPSEFRRESLGVVRFVPLVSGIARTASSRTSQATNLLLAEACEAFAALSEANLAALAERIGDSEIVLIGEATHGTSEFYLLRAMITEHLIANCGFALVALEGDWPDAMALNSYVTGRRDAIEPTAFTRFPMWMWRNAETKKFVQWLRDWNLSKRSAGAAVGIYGLDLYSMYSSISRVIDYLVKVDEAAAETARLRYGCLSPWEKEPANYGRAAARGKFSGCEQEVVSVLTDLLDRRIETMSPNDPDEYLNLVQNARLVVNAERYYREMYRASRNAWNLRDQHMFDTLEVLREARGERTKAVVWAHNSHCGNAEATEMSARGELNLGSLCRREYGERCYLIGFGTHSGTVFAAPLWGKPGGVMQLRPSLPESYEQLCHETKAEAFFLPLRHPHRPEVRDELSEPRIQRAVGVIYRPETERHSHYFEAVLPEQFDEYIWFDSSQALNALAG